MIEIFFVMALLALFGITTYTLVAVGSDSFHDLIEERDDNASLRVSLSMISMKVRQMDAVDAVKIEKGKDSDILVITETSDSGKYNTYLFIRDGQLCEYTSDDSAPFDPKSGFELTELSGVAFSLVNDILRVEVWMQGEAGKTSLWSLIKLRSAGGG